MATGLFSTKKRVNTRTRYEDDTIYTRLNTKTRLAF